MTGRFNHVFMIKVVSRHIENSQIGIYEENSFNGKYINSVLEDIMSGSNYIRT